MFIPIHRIAGRALIVAAVGLVPIARPARAALLFWTNAGGGAAGGAANWNPSQVPTELDILRFELPNTYTVTFGPAVDSVAVLHLWDGDVTLECNATHGVKNQFYVGSQGASTATARLTTGTLRMGTFVRVGTGTGATGTLRVSGGNSNLLQNVFTGNVMDVGGDDTGGGGTGEVVVINGGALEPALDLNLGRNAGSLGTLRVKGLGSGAGGLRRSHAFVDNPAGDCRMGMSGGHGVLEVLEGGWFRVGRDLRVAEVAGEIGEITIGGANTLDSSEVKIKDDLKLCVNPSTLAGQLGGTGSVLLDSLGKMVVDDSTVVGDPDGSSASLTIRPGARLRTKHLILQQPTGSTVALQGGLLQVDGGTLSTFTHRLTLPGSATAAYPPILELLNGATANFTGTTADPPLVVGSTDAMEMRVLGGSQVVANGGRVTLADGAGSFARLSINGEGQLTSDRSAIVGRSGLGQLILGPGGSATFNGADIALGAGGEGNVQVNDGATLTSSGAFNVGGGTLVAGGVGLASIFAGGVLHLSAPLVAGTIWAGPSKLTVENDGLVELTGGLTVRGGLVMNGGEVTGGSVLLRGDGRIEGAGVVDAAILAGTDTTVTIEASGLLELGRDAAGGDVLMRGTLDAGSDVVVVHDPDSAVVGVVELAGGQLHLPAGGGVVEVNKRLTGNGTVVGPLVNRGFVIASGGTGLVIDGTLFGVGQGVGGNKLTFLTDGGFEGAGVIDAPVTASNGTMIRATGDLTMGRTGAGNASILAGRIEAGPYMVTLRGDAPISLHGELVLEGGRLEVAGASGITTHTGSKLTGRGDINAHITADGTISPGLSAGRLRLNGITTLALHSVVAIDLGNHAAGEHDTLSVGYSLLMTTGTTLDLRLLDSFAAVPGDSFKIVEYATHSGTFTNVLLGGAPLAGQAAVHYATDGIWVVILQPIVGVDPDAPGSNGVGTLHLAPFGTPGAQPGVQLALPAEAEVDLRVYDVGGREVAHLHEGVLGPGRHRFELPRDFGAAGIFLVRAVTTREGRSTSMVTRVVRIR